jgi:chromosome segregation ATPase
MRLFNQTGNQLRWDMSPHGVFTCEPWGSLEIKESLVPFVLQLGVPIGKIPVAPEIKAQRRVEQAQTEAAEDVTRQLRDSLLASQAETAAARREVDIRQSELERINARAEKLARELESVRSELEASQVERTAAEALLTEQGNAESQAVADMTKRAADAAAEASVAKAELARVKETLAETEKAMTTLSKERDTLVAHIVRLKADKQASEDLLGETAKRAQDAEKRASELDASLRAVSDKKIEKRARA